MGVKRLLLRTVVFLCLLSISLFYIFSYQSALDLQRNDKRNLHNQNCSTLQKDQIKIKRIEHNKTIANSPNDITVVTAYFDIGSFKKGRSAVFGTHTYQRWARGFRYIHNPLVVYTDSEHFHTLMKSVRATLADKTKIILINRNTSWAFDFEKRIADIYSDRNYPKYYPNTVVSSYVCAQHAKYDVTARAAKANYFGTHLFAWIDIGYFRNKVGSTNKFKLNKPRGFNDSKLAMNLIRSRKMSMQPDIIMKRNIVWVGGGLFLGQINVILKAEEQYKRAVNYFLSQGIMNTDQQIVFAIYSDEGKRIIKPKIVLQIYRSPRDQDWFYLGEQMVKPLDKIDK